MAGFLQLPPFLSPRRGKCPPPSVKSSYRKGLLHGYSKLFLILFSFLLVEGTDPVKAADPSGKLWIERKEAVPKKPRYRAKKQQSRSSQPSRSSSQARQPVRPVQQRRYDPIRVQGKNTRSNGVQRQTLPPVQNAPVDDRYGRSRDDSNQRPRTQRLPNQRPHNQRVALPVDLWRGMTFERFRDGLLALNGVGGSLALNNLVASTLLDHRSMPQNTEPQTADLLKMVVLYRMGRIGDLASFIESIPARNRSLPVRVFKARALLANGERAKACKLVTSFPVGDRNLSRDLLSESLMMTALCAAQNKDLATMGLMADLARDKNIRSPLSFAIMDYLLSGVKPSIKMPPKLGVRDYYFLRLTQLAMPRKLLDRAAPSLVYALAYDRSTSPALRLDAAERAASTGQIDASGLAKIYADVAAIKPSQGQRRSDAHTRALLFAGLSRTNDPAHRAKIIDTLLANVRGKNLSSVIGPMLAPYVAQMQPEPTHSWFAMRAVEVALLARDLPLAERWLLFVKQAGRAAYGAAEWLPLVDLVQPGVVPAGEGTQMALRMARARRLNGATLHRLTSVLDALSLDVPIPLWNTASKQPQPRKGALPPSGVLSALKKMSDEGRAGEVLLLSLQSLGSHSADQMHLIALGDVVRSLKKAGFATSARQFGFEAVYDIWPTGLGRQR